MTNTIEYPVNPSIGDEFTVGGTRKRWDGTKWKNVSFGNHERRLQELETFEDYMTLKVFQSPTDGGLTEIQTRTVNANEVYEVRKTSDDSLATIYSDADGATEIVQNGTDNKSGSDGVVKFYVEDTFDELKIETESGVAKFKNNNVDKRYSANFKTESGYSAVENMIAGRVNGVEGGVTHSIGNRYTTGGTAWKYNGGGSNSLADFTPLTRIYVTDFNVDNTGARDVRSGLLKVKEMAIDNGHKKIRFPTGDYLLSAAGETPTIYNPIRGMLIDVDDVDIKANGANFLMRGVTNAYLISIDDWGSSGRDVFTYFTFLRQKGGKFTGGHFDGENDTSIPFRYQSPRAKGIGVIGGNGCKIKDVSGYGVLGNVINATPSDGNIDGVYEPLVGVKVDNCLTEGCWEGGVNYMGNTFDCDYTNSESNNNANGFEGASDRMIVTNIKAANNRGSQVSISGKNFAVSTLILDGLETPVDSTKGHGLVVSSSPSALVQNGTFEDIKITGMSGFGVHVYPSASDLTFKNVKIKGGNTTEAANYSDFYIVGTTDRKITDIDISDLKINSPKAKWNVVLGHTEESTISKSVLKGAGTLSILDSGTNEGLFITDNICTNGISTSGDTYAQNNITPTSTRQFYQFVAIGAIPTRAGREWRVGDRIINTNTYPGYDWGFVCKTSGVDGVAAFYSMGLVEGVKSTSTSIADASNVINTSQKFQSKQAYLTDTSEVVYASGGSASSVWKFGDGTLAYTPVQP